MFKVVRISKKELEKIKAKEARQRKEQVQRVERGEITAAQANQEAAFIKEPEKWEITNLKEHLEFIAELYPLKKRHARARKKFTLAKKRSGQSCK